MDIRLIRIDDRLIHGQVVVGWVPALSIERLVVVNDAVASNAMQRTLMEIAVPGGLKVSFLTVEEAAHLKMDPAGEKALLLFANPSDLRAYVEKGGWAEEVNVGGLHFKEGMRQVHRVVCVNEDQCADFAALRKKGIQFVIRAVPGDPGEPLEKCLPELTAP